MYQFQRSLGLHQALLVANPIPAQYALPATEVEGYVDQALRDMDEKGVTGKHVTPFLLSRVGELSKGRTLSANVALYRNNVRLACRVAACLKGR